MRQRLLGLGGLALFLLIIWFTTWFSPAFRASVATFQCKDVVGAIGSNYFNLPLLFNLTLTAKRNSTVLFVFASERDWGFATVVTFNNDGPKLVDFSVNGRSILSTQNFSEHYFCD